MSRTGEGLWSTKFVLPEQQAALEKRALEERKRKRPTLDDQELQLIQQLLFESYRNHQRIKMQVYDEHEDRELEGIVTGIHTYRQEIKLATFKDDWEWVRIENILSAK